MVGLGGDRRVRPHVNCMWLVQPCHHRSEVDRRVQGLSPMKGHGDLLRLCQWFTGELNITVPESEVDTFFYSDLFTVTHSEVTLITNTFHNLCI